MSGRSINISGVNPVEDPSYRYKMPSVVGKIEGKGNGIKTVIFNITELALSLHREPTEVNKFFGCELGAQTTYNEADDRAVVNGAHMDQELQQCVHKYVEKFVLCPECGLPETTYSIKQGCIYHRCAACGAKEMVDMNHKLCTFILAQDKKKKKDKSKTDKTKKPKDEGEKDPEKEEKKKKKKKSKDSDDEKKDKKKKDKKKKDKKKSKKKDKDSDGSLADDFDELSVGSDVVGDEGVMSEFCFGSICFVVQFRFVLLCLLVSLFNSTISP
jgi:translation initiation factor 5